MKRLLYIDNLRIFLISLVVLHHLAITYGAPGDWFYNESEAEIPEIVPLAMFVTTNQSFFMGMFFLISAYFILPSLKKKGIIRFITDRLIRLGIPLLIFYFLLCPLTVFIHNRFIRGEEPSYFDYLINGWGRGYGPLWFVEALLIFTLIFLLFRKVPGRINLKFPGNLKILLFAMLIGIGQFIIRIWLPIGWNMPLTDFQLPFFLQYIFLFTIGIVAYQNNWSEVITFRIGKRWFIFAQILIFIGFPLIFFPGGAASGNIDPFMGGLTWQSLAYSIWEQLTGISMIIGLLGIAGKYFNKQGKLASELSGCAYGVFIFHPPVIVSICVLLFHWDIYPFLKFIVLAPVALTACFLVACLVRQIPGLKRIL